MDQQISMFDDYEPEVDGSRVELSMLSNEELMNLRAKIDQELLTRKLAKSATVMRGEYVVGKDIPAGAYTVIGNANGTIFVVHDKRSRLRYNMVCYKKDAIGKVTLNENDVMWISESATFVVYTGNAVTLG